MSTASIPRRLLLVALVLAAGTTAAQSRIVIVNGKLLSDANLARLERMNCHAIPDGSYWLNTATGAWGYAGNPQVQGVFGDACRGGGGGGGAGGINADGTYGPYATGNRAQQVANDFRRRGLEAVWFHNGDGYYVRVKQR